MVEQFMIFAQVTMYIYTYSVQYVKRPGAVLDGGAIVARLVLDDPTRVKMVSFLFHL